MVLYWRIFFRIFTRILLPGSAAFLAACGGEPIKGDSPRVKLVLEHLSNTSRAGQGLTPTYFGLKFLNVALQSSQDIKTPIVSSSIYINSSCEDVRSNFIVDGKKYEYVGVPDCKPEDMGDYFDFAQATDGANSALQAEAKPVLPAAYKFVTIGFCTESTEENNLRFKVEGGDPQDAKVPVCGLYSAEMSSPLVLEEEETAEVTLSYDLTGMILPTDKIVADSCVKLASGTVLCANIPTFDAKYAKKDL